LNHVIMPAPASSLAAGGPRLTIAQQSAQTEAGGVTSAARVDACLERIADPQGEGQRVFIKVWDQQARQVAAAQDSLLKAGYRASRLAGVPVSIKDLLDVKGEVTRAGSIALDDAPAASSDAPVVQRLKAAGAVLVGRTNMTQFAFSVVGLNSHFGTPGNPWDRKRIPGGSSSGAAVSVADDMATAAIGSDTVGSIRVPAALCGIVGFKPTQCTVPLRGAIPLSTTLDSIGPMAHTVADCAEVYAVIAGQAAQPLDLGVKGLRLAIPREVVLDDLDAEIASVFELACSAISQAGAALSTESFPALAAVHALNGNGVIQPAEALSWHRELLRRRAQDYDPRIKARIETGLRIQASDYIAMLERRQQLIEAFDHATKHYDALVMPTVAIVAPTFDECANAEDAIRTRLLRNSAPFNFLDRCAISLPIHRPGDAPVGLMLVGRRGGDWALLKVAHAIESLFPSFASRAEAR
jgi:aspartyl-tRNA(Asn)/glutamyl-tRNA(Gln) amidotransferase subunit A